MNPARHLFGAALFCVCAVRCLAEPQPSLLPEQQDWLSKAKRFERAGWIYLHIEGEPRQRGFQHGYLLGREIAEGLRVTRLEWRHHSAMEWTWLVPRAAALFVPKIDAENLATGANVCLIVGGVLAGVGAITTLLTFVDDASAKSVALAPALGPSFAGLTMRGNW